MTVDILIFTYVDGKLYQRAIGAYQMAHFLRTHGYTVQVIDFIDSFSLDELRHAVNVYVGDSTLAVGISTTFMSSIGKKYISSGYTYDAVLPDNLITVLQEIKETYPEIKVITGGSRSADTVGLPFVDCVIHGYAEDKLLNYITSLKHTRILPTEITSDVGVTTFNIESLSHKFTDSDFIYPSETLPIEISRGCIFKCKFCAFPLNGKKKLDFLRSPALIADEIKHNYHTYGTTNYFINDDTFNDSTFKLEQLHREISKLPFRIKFTCYLRLDLLYAHKEQISMLYDMGLASPFFGIESLNQKSASAIGKGMDCEKVKEFVVELYKDYWREELPITCSFIVGLPHETVESVHSTFEWCKTAPINSLFLPLSLSSKSVYRSEFQTNYAKYGYILYNNADGKWRNEHFTYDSAQVLAEKFNNEMLYTNNIPSSWFLMALLSHGISLDDARSTQMHELNWSKILRSKKLMINAYKSKILQNK